MGGSSYLDTARRVVEQARKMGAEQVEAFFSYGRELSIEVVNQEVETMKMAEDRGLGVRVIRAGRLGFAFSSDLEPPALDRVVEQALAISRQTAQDEFNSLPRPFGSYAKMDIFDPQIEEANVEEKIALAKKMEKAGRGADSRVKITERAAYQDSDYRVVVANSEGIEASYQGAYCGIYLDLVAQDGDDNQTGFSVQYSLKYRDLSPEKVGREAAEKAVRMLGAKKINTRKMPVVLDPYIATNFLGVIAPALTAEAKQKGRSLFADKAGQKVASDKVTVIDDGVMPGGLMSSPFDGEGVPTGKTVLIQDGRLLGFLYNTYTAAKDNVASTGNGSRGSFKSTPDVGTTNFYLKPGTVSRDQLLGGIKDGLYVTEVMGMHTANPISGDFSLGAAGLRIENGKLTVPVRGVAIAGNIIDLLESIDEVADDLTFFVGKGAPTVRIARMTVSGS